jgi:hypothetical protein
MSSMMLADVQVALPHVQKGSMRALAITGKQRSSITPDVPTLAEEGLAEVDMITGWAGLFAPASTPTEIVNRLNAEVRRLGVADGGRRSEGLVNRRLAALRIISPASALQEPDQCNRDQGICRLLRHRKHYQSSAARRRLRTSHGGARWPRGRPGTPAAKLRRDPRRSAASRMRGNGEQNHNDQVITHRARDAPPSLDRSIGGRPQGG